MKSYKYLSKIVGIIFLAHLLLANFAFAQTAPATQTSNTNPDIVFDKAKLDAAQNDPQKCLDFSNQFLTATSGFFRTVYVEYLVAQRLGTYSTACKIMPGNTQVTQGGPNSLLIYNSTDPQPPGSKIIQTNIEEGKGLQTSDLQAAFNQDHDDAVSASGPSKVVGTILKFLLDIIANFLGWLTSFALGILAYATNQAVSVTTMPLFVDVGWSIVRDFANMFFILIMIVIGIASILRIETYNYKHLLVKVILMALLVNFSKVIAVAIYNAFNLLLAVFALDGSLKDTFGWIYKFINQDFWTIPNGWMAGVTQGLTKIAFLLVTCAVSIALALLMIVRQVGIYVLVILSPLAYVLNILHITEHEASQWWSYFIKY
ncbi:MAG TPA: hypothetical protein VL306_01375, partial [Methylomirabilota bacterium]|nr:hypothetical protein [Methylomirabilota bacterium]